MTRVVTIGEITATDVGQTRIARGGEGNVARDDRPLRAREEERQDTG